MNSVTKRVGRDGKRQGRRVMPALRRRRAKSVKGAVKGCLTVGELVAAAFDTVGAEVKDVAKLLSSTDMACAIQRRIVLT
jgi:hypothetical protein